MTKAKWCACHRWCRWVIIQDGEQITWESMTLATHVNRLVSSDTPTRSRACVRLGSSDTPLIVPHLTTSA